MLEIALQSYTRKMMSHGLGLPRDFIEVQCINTSDEGLAPNMSPHKLFRALPGAKRHADTNSLMLNPSEGESSADPLQHSNQGPQIGDPVQGAVLSQAQTAWNMWLQPFE